MTEAKIGSDVLCHKWKHLSRLFSRFETPNYLYFNDSPTCYKSRRIKLPIFLYFMRYRTTLIPCQRGYEQSGTDCFPDRFAK